MSEPKDFTELSVEEKIASLICFSFVSGFPPTNTQKLWAYGWLSGKDRTHESALRVYRETAKKFIISPYRLNDHKLGVLYAAMRYGSEEETKDSVSASLNQYFSRAEKPLELPWVVRGRQIIAGEYSASYFLDGWDRKQPEEMIAGGIP